MRHLRALLSKRKHVSKSQSSCFAVLKLLELCFAATFRGDGAHLPPPPRGFSGLAAAEGGGRGRRERAWAAPLVRMRARPGARLGRLAGSLELLAGEPVSPGCGAEAPNSFAAGTS